MHDEDHKIVVWLVPVRATSTKNMPTNKSGYVPFGNREENNE